MGTNAHKSLHFSLPQKGDISHRPGGRGEGKHGLKWQLQRDVSQSSSKPGCFLLPLSQCTWYNHGPFSDNHRLKPERPGQLLLWNLYILSEQDSSLIHPPLLTWRLLNVLALTAGWFSTPDLPAWTQARLLSSWITCCPAGRNRAHQRSLYVENCLSTPRTTADPLEAAEVVNDSRKSGSFKSREEISVSNDAQCTYSLVKMKHLLRS